MTATLIPFPAPVAPVLLPRGTRVVLLERELRGTVIDVDGPLRLVALDGGQQEFGNITAHVGDLTPPF